MRPARDQARPHPRRRGHAAPAAAHRRREGAGRHSVRRRRSARARPRNGAWSTNSPRRGSLREVRDRLRAAPDRREGALEEGARPDRKARAGARPSRDLRGHPQGQCAKVPRLRGLGEGDRIGQERGRSALRRGRREGARHVHGAASDDAVQGPALRLFRRAAGGEGRRHRGRHADPEDRQGRRDRRRHHGRRHRHEFPQRRHSGHHRRDLERGARSRRLDHAAQLRGDRQEGPPDDGRSRGADGEAHRRRSTSMRSPTRTS